MENIVPVSDMRFYNEALSGVEEGSPVILTKNGKPVYTVVDFQEWKVMQATLKLFEKLQRGYTSLASEETYIISDFAKKYGIEE